jgi:SAM-dependent methyltransferase
MKYAFKKMLKSWRSLGPQGALSSRIAEAEAKMRAEATRTVAEAEARLLLAMETARERERDAILASRLAIAEAIGRLDLVKTRERRRPTERSETEDLRLLEEMLPKAFPIWRRLFEAGKRVYESAPLGSLSVESHPGAAGFRGFIAPFVTGHVLDVGCGPQSMPSYLSGLPIQRLAGIDPLPGAAKKFEFVRGFAEFLPWPDAEFDAIVCATSLDHVLSLDRTFAEFRRVLRKGGSILIWVGFVSGADAYDPIDNPVALDEFHMFHFDRPWFEERVLKDFRIEENFAFDSQSTFYRLS